MKSTKMQTLGTVAFHATTACTEDASSVPLNSKSRSTQLGYSLVFCLVLHVVGFGNLSSPGDGMVELIR